MGKKGGSGNRHPNQQMWACRLKYEQIAVPNLPTAWDLELSKRGLNNESALASLEMRSWAQSHRKSKYIPEKVLEYWGMSKE